MRANLFSYSGPKVCNWKLESLFWFCCFSIVISTKLSYITEFLLLIFHIACSWGFRGSNWPLVYLLCVVHFAFSISSISHPFDSRVFLFFLISFHTKKIVTLPPLLSSCILHFLNFFEQIALFIYQSHGGRFMLVTTALLFGIKYWTLKCHQESRPSPGLRKVRKLG